MYALMFYQAILLSECLITHVTQIWTLTAMYALMSDKITPISECLFTHITVAQTIRHKICTVMLGSSGL